MERHYGQQETPEYPHPFVHHVKLTKAEKIRGVLLGSVLFPLRMIIGAVLFLLAWPISRLRFAGVSEEDRLRPVTGWRKWAFHPIIWLLSRAVFATLGFLWVKVKGQRADLKEAPVLVVAPHSGFLDMIVLFPTQLATVVSRSENCSLPVIGALLEFNQSVLVSRKDPESRKMAVAQLSERLTSNGYWPQMLMFPEGTTTNGRALIKFKPGAFLTGVPVQPVLLHYPNKLDTVRWTYKGTTWLDALWHTTSQLYTRITVEFLPVYNPSEEEKRDPNLYADNVQKIMAKALGIPATDYVMEGGMPVRKLGGLSLPLESPARETLSVLQRNGLRAAEVESALDRMMETCLMGAEESKADVEKLSSLLGLSDQKAAVTIRGLYSKDEVVDLRQIYLSVATISGYVGFKTLLHTAFTFFDREGRGTLGKSELPVFMGALLGVPQHNTDELYAETCRAGALTEERLHQVLTTHPTYQRVVNEHLQPEERRRLPFNTLADMTTVNNNGNLCHNKTVHHKLE